MQIVTKYNNYYITIMVTVDIEIFSHNKIVMFVFIC